MLCEAESKSQGYWALQTLRRVPSLEADGVGLWGLGFMSGMCGMELWATLVVLVLSLLTPETQGSGLSFSLRGGDERGIP